MARPIDEDENELNEAVEQVEITEDDSEEQQQNQQATTTSTVATGLDGVFNDNGDVSFSLAPHDNLNGDIAFDTVVVDMIRFLISIKKILT